jgi:hypothetical protein
MASACATGVSGKLQCNGLFNKSNMATGQQVRMVLNNLPFALLPPLVPLLLC